MPGRPVRIRYFAWLREKIGAAEETLDVPAEVQTAAQLITWLQTRDARHFAAFAEPEVVRCAIDQELVGRDARIGGAREIAFFPPVTGG